jgi:tRNA(Ile)-lysidine synthase
MSALTANRLLRRVEATIEEHRLLDSVSKAIIAFSGGPDSVCLLDVLRRIFHDEVQFEIVYVNHGLRPESELRREEAKVRTYAKRYKMPCSIISVKVRSTGIGLEAAARKARYDALHSHLEKTGAERIVLGHNLDDFVETFLLNIVRGSGMAGMRAIPVKRLPYVRPLLHCRKAEILNYLKTRRLSYIVDRTNLSLEYRRNLIRRKVVPFLLKLNPEIHEAIRRESQILKRDDEYIWAQALRVYERTVHSEKDCAILDINRLRRYNRAVAIRLVMKAVEELSGSLDGYESKHYYSIYGLTNRECSKKVNLPKGLYAQREYGKIAIGRVRAARNFQIPVEIDKGCLEVGNWRLKIKAEKGHDKAEVAGNREVFDLERLSLPLYVRNKRPGDIIETKVGRKKLKKVYSEKRIPPRERGNTLLLCDQRGILWVIGFARAYRGFVGSRTRKKLVVEFERID